MPTRKDDLHSGTPLWVRTPRSTIAAAHRLVDRSADVVVVGTGISGALVAEQLTRDGHSVLILDRRQPARGSTAASTAMILHELDVPLTHLRRTIAPRSADAAWRRSATAVNELIALVQRLGIDCDFRRKRTLYLAGDRMGARALATEAAARDSIGTGATFLRKAELRERFGIERTGAIESADSASANPARLTTGLLRVALDRGARLVSPVEVTGMAQTEDTVALATREGQVIVAKHAVFCTGYEYLTQMETDTHRVTTTWALATRPLQGLPPWLRDTLVWEASSPYLYFRTDAAGRIIAGGEDEDGADGGGGGDGGTRLRAKARTISRKLADLLKIEVGRPAYTWSAPFGVTKDGLPIIDRVPGFERIYTVMGFGGNGITFALIGARIVAALVAGGSDPDAHLFRFR